ncbi:hypothetical protein H8356DRAFT_1360048 [Neocallimastix lanati (nom. inval.)]|nr:hypothetical protein H8356DRAFT_1360048 [Neocallimastix sp. JGI-2020a]
MQNLTSLYGQRSATLICYIFAGLTRFAICSNCYDYITRFQCFKSNYNSLIAGLMDGYMNG